MPAVIIVCFSKYLHRNVRSSVVQSFRQQWTATSLSDHVDVSILSSDIRVQEKARDWVSSSTADCHSLTTSHQSDAAATTNCDNCGRLFDVRRRMPQRH